MGDEVLVPNLPRLGMGVGKHALRFLAFPAPSELSMRCTYFMISMLDLLTSSISTSCRRSYARYVCTQYI